MDDQKLAELQKAYVAEMRASFAEYRNREGWTRHAHRIQAKFARLGFDPRNTRKYGEKYSVNSIAGGKENGKE